MVCIANSYFFSTLHIILTEQMRQKDDLEYQNLLHRATTCALTEDDIQLLNTRSKSNLLSKNMRVPDLAIRPRNEERHDFNRLAVERFAAERNQKVWMFAASHNRPRGNTQTSYNSVGSMLNHSDGGKFKGPGIFFSPLECLLCFWRISWLRWSWSMEESGLRSILLSTQKQRSSI